VECRGGRDDDGVSIKQRLYPDTGVEVALVEHCQMHRFVWNLGLEQRAMWEETRRHFVEKVTYNTQARQLTELRADVDWVRAGSTVVQQGALRDLDRAFDNFFKGTHAYPQFKKRNWREGSFTVRDVTVRRLSKKWGTVLIPKAGWVRFRLTRPWTEITNATSARVTLRNGAWHVSFTTPPRRKINPGTGEIAGIDRGVANSIATSDGDFHQAPTLSTGEQKRFLALQRRLARQHKGSNRRTRTLDQLAVLRRTLDNRRTDWIEQTTTSLARRYDLIALEDLRVTNMVRKPKAKPDPEREGAFLPNGAAAKASLNRAILASCWGQFATRLAHKTNIEKTNPRNTSRECNNCGHIDARNRESQAVFECVRCGHQAHADTNAAQNCLDRWLHQQHNQPEDTTKVARTRVSGARTRQPRKSRVNHLTAA